MSGQLQQALAQTFGVRVAQMVAVSGGDINEAHRVHLADGRCVFVKSHPDAPPAMFDAEAAGLTWLGEAGALKVPAVLATRAAQGGAPAFLALEFIAAGEKGVHFDERFGRALAALHRAGAPGFGFATANFIGTLPQDNRLGKTWATFYRERRLQPQLRRAVDGGHLSPALAADLERVLNRLDELVGPPEPPARLHGDLWGGNHMASAAGEPVVFDPAVYGGHREMDLAMMRLFGGYGARAFAAYDEAFPLSPGHGARVPLCQLYPLLVHVNLFAGGYVGQLQAATRAALAL